MSKLYQGIFIVVIVMLMSSCAAPAVDLPTPSAVPSAISTSTTQPTPQTLPEVKIVQPPTEIVDLRSQDLSKSDMTGSLSELMYANFNSKTQWPPADKLPAEFDPQKIMEIGKDPGLGVRALHEQGITGKGIAIAIVDQPLFDYHEEFMDRIRLYEEINYLPKGKPTLHGPAVASIAVGKTTGVAPEADLYYIGSWTGDWDPETDSFTPNLKYYAQAIHRILEWNQSLPEDHKIRAIAVQVGWTPDQAGYDEINAAVEEAKKAGVFVISCHLSENYGLKFHGLGREPLADPNDFSSYEPGFFWQQQFFDRGSLSNYLLVPMDSRTTAGQTGTEDYVFYRDGGWSWAVPYLAGMYALAAQVKPEITPEEFWSIALKTGRTIPIQHDGKEYQFGVILDPQALIEEIKGK